MESNHISGEKEENGQRDNHVILAVEEEPELEREWITSAEEKINQAPNLLKKTAGNRSCSIFRVPQSLAKVHDTTFEPLILSVGPYHHGKEHLKMIQQHKWRYLSFLLARIKDFGVGLEDLFRKVASLEDRIRESYSEIIGFDRRELVEMMVLDGCFIIELFCRTLLQQENPDSNSDRNDDPVLKIPWVVPFLTLDLLKLENQMPCFVLKELFQLCRISSLQGAGQSEHELPTLTAFALNFFNKAVGRETIVLKKFYDFNGEHLLDVFCLSFYPFPKESEQSRCGDLRSRFCFGNNIHLPGNCFSFGSRGSTDGGLKSQSSQELINSAQRLHHAGIRFKLRKAADTFLDIKYRDGVLEIPHLTMDSFSRCVFLNAIAFEQCYVHRLDLFTTYVTFLCCLINSPTDAEFLSDRKILESYLGNGEEVVRFFSDVRKDVVFDMEKCYLVEVFEGIDRYRMKRWHVHWAEFRHSYFRSPWTFLSVLAALAGLTLAAIQAYYSANPKN